MTNRLSSDHSGTDKIVDLLDEDHRRFSPLQRLLKTSANQKQWTQQFRAMLDQLDPALHHQVEITQVAGPNLTVLCHNAATATRLRFLLPGILPELRKLQGFAGVQTAQIRVANR